MERTVERSCRSRGLSTALKGSLSQHPGSIHWHFKNPQYKGTLELTLCPAKSRLWSKVQAGRKAAWIDETLLELKNDIETELAAVADRVSRKETE